MGVTDLNLLENLPRVMPAGTCAIIDSNRWQRPPIFDWLQENGNVTDEEMYRTFNCGIGMVLCVAETDVETTLHLLTEQGESASVIGRIETATGDSEQVIVNERRSENP